MDHPQPLSPRAAPRPVARLNRKVLWSISIVLILLTSWLITRGFQPHTPAIAKEEPRREGYAATLPDFLQAPLPLTPVRVAQAAAPPPEPPPAALEPRQAIPQAPHKTVAVGAPPPRLPPPPKTPTPPQSSAAATHTETPPPNKWLFPQGGARRVTAPFPDERPTEQQTRPTGLIGQAQWAQCAEPTRCLYETQLIHGQIVQAINSDIPGMIWIKVTNNVTDMFGQGVTLVPQGATLVGTQQGQPRVGQERLDFLVQRGILPDGTVLSFAGSRLGDASGATGLEGKVNNHYVKLGIATILTAALSVGARQAGGTSDGFRSTPEEEFGRDIAGSVNTSGREIIRRQLVQGPTITLKQGTPVVVQLKETVSLQTPPVIVRY